MHAPRIAVLLTALASLACQQDSTIPKLDTPVIGLKVTVTDSVLVLGAVDTIRVVITNTLTSAVRLTFATQCQDRVYIRNAAGTVVLPPSGVYDCARVNSLLTIPAKDSVTRTYLWTGGATFLPPDPQAKLPPGRYQVSAIVAGTNYSVTAFPVTVRLTATR